MIKGCVRPPSGAKAWTMKKANLLALALIASPLACETMGPPLTPPPPPPPVATVAVAPQPPPVEPAKPAEPTPEEKKKAEAEKKKAEAAQKLAADRAQWDADSQLEAARWTPEVHAAAKALVEAKYPSLKAALTAVLKSKHRKPVNAARDVYRHPLETLEFFGLKPTMAVLDYGPGDGWYTEVLAPVLAPKGKLLVTINDPNGPPDSRATFAGQRFKRFLETGPELYGKVETVVTGGPVPNLGIDGKLDMVLLFRELHGAHQNKQLPALLGEAFKALKPGGTLGVVQHRAPEGANPDESAKKGYLPQAFVIAQAEAVGFKLAGKSEINANPKDTKDYAEGVWTLPPTFQLKDKDHQKYADIGESDRMTLKFTKPLTKPKK
jgi:predicted methyltransferase